MRLAVFSVLASTAVLGCTAPRAHPAPLQPSSSSRTTPPRASAASSAQAEGAQQRGNPASEYCIQHGGRLEIRSDSSGGQWGACVFPGGSECEEWAFYRQECQPSS
jgi:hypothetical protein